MWHILYNMGCLQATPTGLLLCGPEETACGLSSFQLSWHLEWPCEEDVRGSWSSPICQGHTRDPRCPSPSSGADMGVGHSLPQTPKSLRRSSHWVLGQLPKEGAICAEASEGPWLTPSFLAAEASGQCSALALQVLRSHAALLPPVALHCPVALQTVSDPEEVTLKGGVSAENRRGDEPLSCCALSLPRV